MRFYAAALHLVFSAFIAILCGIVVFWLWYPSPYASIAGGASIFMLLISVDVVLGPVLTAVVADPRKSIRSLRRDLGVIVLVQLIALAYGMSTVAQARPVHLVFEVDRMRVVTAADIDSSSLAQAPEGLGRLPWTGPTPIAVAKPVDPQQQMDALMLGLAGTDLSMIPANWRTYDSMAGAIWAKARPIENLGEKYPGARESIAKLAGNVGESQEALRFLPLQTRRASWSVVISAKGSRIVGYLPYDGFF